MSILPNTLILKYPFCLFRNCSVMRVRKMEEDSILSGSSVSGLKLIINLLNESVLRSKRICTLQTNLRFLYYAEKF